MKFNLSYLLPLIVVILLSGCTTQVNNSVKESPNENVQNSIEWVDMIMWSNNKYYYDADETEIFIKENIEKEIGEIKFSVVGSSEENNLNYQLKNGEATFVGKGSKIYSIIGKDFNKMIVAQNKVYKKK